MSDTAQPEEPATYHTQDEAIAAAMAEVGPGGIVVVHSDTCTESHVDDARCTCEPLELRLGAEA